MLRPLTTINECIAQIQTAPRCAANTDAGHLRSAITLPKGRISLLDLDFDDLDLAQAAAWIAARPAEAPFGYVVTPNADHLVRLSREPALRTFYRDAALCLLDSRVVGGLARLLGLSFPAVVPGSDLTEHLLVNHLLRGERITIVGLPPSWLPALVARCRLAPPAHYDPPMGFDRDPVAFAETVAFVRANPARFVFLAVGSPRQERLAAAIAASGDVTGTGLCIGASLEFLAGACRRAPPPLRRMGLEWLFRFAGNPRKLFRRYVIDSPAVITLLVKQLLSGRRSSRGASAGPVITGSGPYSENRSRYRSSQPRVIVPPQVLGVPWRGVFPAVLDSHRDRRISVAIYFHDLSPGGVERQSLVLARELRARGADVTLVVHAMQGALLSLLPPGVPVLNLRSARTLQDVFRLRRYLLDEQPDLLLANVDHNNIAAALANALAGTATKLVICQHNPISAGFHATVNWKHRAVPWLYRGLASRVDHAVAVSGGIAGELVGIGLVPSKVSTIFNAVIGDDFADRSRAQVHHPWLLQKDRPVFVSAGRLVATKDQQNLLRAFAIHLRTHPTRLILLGMGPKLAELQALAGSLGIAEHVAFEGFVQNPLPYMCAADGFVLSSRFEGFGNVLVEAMGCGTPVLSTDCPYGPAEILAHGQFGILVPPRDPEALASGLARLHGARARWPADLLRERAGAFSYRACADAYARLFRSLVLTLDDAVPQDWPFLGNSRRAKAAGL
jgi:exopolysaccharide biosynthesis WecB/TagA/CpsF family protein